MDYRRIKVTKEEIKKLRALGLLDEITLRNLKIKKTFYQLKGKRRKGKKKKMSSAEAVRIIAADLNMEQSSVRKAIYGKYSKKPLFSPVQEI